MLLYFVEGHALCARKRAAERTAVTTVAHPYDRDFALAQYALWLSANAGIAADKTSRHEFEIENPPPPRKKCLSAMAKGFGSTLLTSARMS
ncbi:MAG: hypothetical protein H0V78_08535 [Burkholderiales bacterium]|nr:hypothetical protein [Burkholderiales bacterium]